VRTLAAAFILIGLLSTRAQAQWRSAVAVRAPVTSSGLQIDRRAVAVSDGDSWRTRDFWTWTGLGALAGTIAAGGWVALEIAHSHSDDSMIPPIIPIAIIGAAGGVSGGLIGAIAYTAAHPRPEPSPQ
jgi:hypothetical protein